MKAMVQIARCGRGQQGFTLVEVMIASSVGTLTLVAMLTVYISMMELSGKAQQYAWAQAESMRASKSLVSYFRNAASIQSIDDNGNWIQLRMPDGSVSRFEYSNPNNRDGAGQLLFRRNITSEVAEAVVANGLSKVMTLPVRNVFEAPGNQAVRIAFRVTKPLSPGECPAEIDVGVRLRN